MYIYKYNKERDTVEEKRESIDGGGYVTPGMNDLSDGHRVLFFKKKKKKKYKIESAGSLYRSAMAVCDSRKGAKGKRLDALHLMEWTPTESLLLHSIDGEKEKEEKEKREREREQICIYVRAFEREGYR